MGLPEPSTRRQARWSAPEIHGDDAAGVEVVAGGCRACGEGRGEPPPAVLAGVGVVGEPVGNGLPSGDRGRVLVAAVSEGGRAAEPVVRQRRAGRPVVGEVGEPGGQHDDEMAVVVKPHEAVAARDAAVAWRWQVPARRGPGGPPCGSGVGGAGEPAGGEVVAGAGQTLAAGAQRHSAACRVVEVAVDAGEVRLKHLQALLLTAMLGGVAIPAARLRRLASADAGSPDGQGEAGSQHRRGLPQPVAVGPLRGTRGPPRLLRVDDERISPDLRRTLGAQPVEHLPLRVLVEAAAVPRPFGERDAAQPRGLLGDRPQHERVGVRRAQMRRRRHIGGRGDPGGGTRQVVAALAAARRRPGRTRRVHRLVTVRRQSRYATDEATTYPNM